MSDECTVTGVGVTARWLAPTDKDTVVLSRVKVSFAPLTAARP